MDGSKPLISARAKMLWDDEYIYAGYEIDDPNVAAFYGERSRGDSGPRDNCGEPEIMLRDTFVKLFLDPDADGLNYVEIHINPINNVADLVLECPFTPEARKELGLPLKIKAVRPDSNSSFQDWFWTCEGLRSAVRVQGTLNFSGDTDKGWTVELAVPWEALKPLTKGAYSPVAGDNKWRAHLGHVYKPEFDYSKRRKSKHLYGTWPSLGMENCHLPSRWGYLIFDGARKGVPR